MCILFESSSRDECGDTGRGERPRCTVGAMKSRRAITLTCYASARARARDRLWNIDRQVVIYDTGGVIRLGINSIAVCRDNNPLVGAVQRIVAYLTLYHYDIRVACHLTFFDIANKL